MSRDEFINEYRHSFGGLIADAFVSEAKSGELSMRMRSSFRIVDQLLAEVYAKLTTLKPAPANGPVTPARK